MPIGAPEQSVRNSTVSMAAHGGCTNRLEHDEVRTVRSTALESPPISFRDEVHSHAKTQAPRWRPRFCSHNHGQRGRMHTAKTDPACALARPAAWEHNPTKVPKPNCRCHAEPTPATARERDPSARSQCPSLPPSVAAQCRDSALRRRTDRHPGWSVACLPDWIARVPTRPLQTSRPLIATWARSGLLPNLVVAPLQPKRGAGRCRDKQPGVAAGRRRQTQWVADGYLRRWSGEHDTHIANR